MAGNVITEQILRRAHVAEMNDTSITRIAKLNKVDSKSLRLKLAEYRKSMGLMNPVSRAAFDAAADRVAPAHTDIRAIHNQLFDKER